jgi:DNA polymerase-4
VRAELGLPISIGVARTKHLAKIASQVAKPDGLVVVDPKTELNFLHDLPVELMWGFWQACGKTRIKKTGWVCWKTRTNLVYHSQCLLPCPSAPPKL